jgi:hypothetical protein
MLDPSFFQPQSKPQSPPCLYTIHEAPGVFVEACVSSPDKQLTFMSVLGRDTALQHLRAAISLADTERGLAALTLKAEGKPDFRVLLGNFKQLDDNHRTRLKLPPYGVLSQIWFVDKRCYAPDVATQTATVLTAGLAVNTSKLWETITELASVPLLAHWQSEVLTRITGLITPLVGVGCVTGVSITLPADFDVQVGRLVALGVLAQYPVMDAVVVSPKALSQLGALEVHAV